MVESATKNLQGMMAAEFCAVAEVTSVKKWKWWNHATVNSSGAVQLYVKNAEKEPLNISAVNHSKSMIKKLRQ